MLFGPSAPRPLNTYPMWKYVIVVMSILIAIIYSLPNFYGEDPALQIAAEKGKPLTEASVAKLKTTLADSKLAYKSIEQEGTAWLVRFHSTDEQLLAQSLLSKALGDEANVAMNLAPATPAWLKALGASPMKRGLDLSGGIHFLMEIDMDTALKKKDIQLIDSFKAEMRGENIRYTSVDRDPTGGVQARFRDDETRSAGEKLLKRNNPDLLFTELQDGDFFVLKAKLSEAALTAARSEAVAQNLSILRNRVNELGVAEPQIQRQGEERIVVQLPGIQDSEQAKRTLSATATLEFRAVNQERDIQDALNGRVPADSELLNDMNGRPYLVKKQVIAEGSSITDARTGIDQNGLPDVSVTLDSKGGQKMLAHTKQNVGKLMASVLIEYKTEYEEIDGKRVAKPPKKISKIISAATLQGVFGSKFQVTGLEAQEARDLSLLLRSGALIAPIQIVEERTIGPSLGKENIESGFKAAVFGVGAVMIFMLAYYRVFGLFANIAVVINIGLIVTLLGLTGAVLTLPGIAGLVLTVGMAVDANVLIYERIKDELRAGTSPALAIDRGYERAFGTMVDAHLTTLIAALALMAVGSGPVKGFAITLSLGIPTTIFTAQMVARAFTNWTHGGRNFKKLSI